MENASTIVKFDEAPYKQATVFTMPHDFETMKQIFESAHGQNIVELPFIHNKNGVIIYDEKSIPVTLLHPEKQGNAVIGYLKTMIPDTTIDDCINCNMVIFLDSYGKWLEDTFVGKQCEWPHSCGYNRCDCKNPAISDPTVPESEYTANQKCCRRLRA